jgi:sugar lactone lactonase YvrE
MDSWKAEVFIKADNILGEGPDWNPSAEILSWVDILAKKFHYYDFKKNQLNHIDTKEVIGFAIPTTKNNTYITGQLDELCLLNIESKEQELLKSVPENKKLNRFNDAKCDSNGRLWAGTTTDDFKNAPAGLYLMDNNLTIKKVMSNIGCSNGLCWSSDNKKMYYIDTSSLTLKSFDFTSTTGAFSNESILLKWPGENGYLDGMTIDASGKLWIAIWNGGKVIRFCPETKNVIGEIKVNAKKPTSAVFGGKNLEKLFITSARVGTESSDLKNNPEEGSIFVVETKIKGTQNYRFRFKENQVI